ACKPPDREQNHGDNRAEQQDADEGSRRNSNPDGRTEVDLRLDLDRVGTDLQVRGRAAEQRAVEDRLTRRWADTVRAIVGARPFDAAVRAGRVGHLIPAFDTAHL